MDTKYRCKKCGYEGEEFVYQYTEETYCVASNEEEPEYISGCPGWVTDSGAGEIGVPVGCPKCRAWGVTKFMLI